MKKFATISMLIVLIMSVAWGGFEQGFSTTSVPTGWQDNAMYYNSTANHGTFTGSNGAGFNALNDWLITEENATAGELSFYIKGSASVSNIGLKIEKSNDGTNWSELAVYEKGRFTSSWELISISVNDESASVYFRFLIHDRSGNSLYLDDIKLTDYSGVTAEPTNHATLFSANENSYNQVDITWTDAIGENLPDRYLILANTTGSFSDPSDGIDQTVDTDLSDGSAIVKVLYGIETYSFSGLNESTTYYFKIWPYSNSGEDIDYKTDGTVPTDNATTEVAPITVLPTGNMIFISEVCDDDAGDYSTGFMEIYNTTSSIINLGNTYIERWAAGLYDNYTYTFGSDVMIPANGYIIVARSSDQSNFETAWGVNLNALNSNYDAGSTNLYFTTGRGYKLYNSNNELLDETDGDVEDSKRDVQTTIGNWTKGQDPSNGNPGTADSDQSLPVCLSSFTATANNGSVEIAWTTESEINNLGFNLYRSENKDGNFEKIAGLIEGAGNSTEKHTYSYCDAEVVAGHTYYYQLEDVSTTGKTEKHDAISIVLDENSINEAKDFQLHAAYPNPCNPTTNIRFDVPKQSLVTLRIFDLQGRLVKNLVSENRTAGNYNVTWNGTDNNNNTVGNGVYLYQLTTETGFSQTNKVILLK